MKLPEKEQIQSLLYQLGAGPNYIGFHCLTEAILLCLEDNSRLLSITKSIYPQTGLYFSISPSAVERNIRTAIHIIWKRNRPFLEKIAGYKLARHPTSGQFLSIITIYFSSCNRTLTGKT